LKTAAEIKSSIQSKLEPSEQPNQHQKLRDILKRPEVKKAKKDADAFFKTPTIFKKMIQSPLTSDATKKRTVAEWLVKATEGQCSTEQATKIAELLRMKGVDSMDALLAQWGGAGSLTRERLEGCMQEALEGYMFEGYLVESSIRGKLNEAAVIMELNVGA
jgi:hypothetical protein